MAIAYCLGVPTNMGGKTLNRSILQKMALAAGVAIVAMPALAQDTPGVTDTTIKLGNTIPYSGPASAYGQLGKTLSAYMDKVNADGGVCGRQIDFISYDDGYSPPKTVEQTRKLVESDNVLATVYQLGTPTNSAIHRYMNQKKVPHLFLATGATKWGDPEHYPWTIGFNPAYQPEARLYAKYIMEQKPDAKIGVLYQNDDYGKDYLKGLKDGLGDKAGDMIVAEQSYETSDPTVDSQMVALKNSGANVFVNITTPKFAAQAIKKAAEIGWKPDLHMLNNVSTSIGSVLKPAGIEASTGVITASYLKEPGDPQWDGDQGLKDWNAFMDKYYPDGDKTSNFTVTGYTVGQLIQITLEKACDDLTREGLMKAVADLDEPLPLFLPGISFKTGPDDFFGIDQFQLAKFNGERWELFGDVTKAPPGPDSTN